MRLSSAISVLVIAFASVCLQGCSPQNRENGYIYYRLSANPATLDPAQIVDVPGGTLAAKLFNGLVRMDDDLKIIPDIAESWSLSPDGLTYIFRLKKGVTFSDKREVKARDFKYSFERILDPAKMSPNTWVFEKILGAEEYMKGRAGDVSGIRAVEDYILEVRLTQPFAPFLSLLTMTAAYVVPREAVEKWGADFPSHPVGTGPFTLREWIPGREIRLDKREDYFGVAARVSGLIYRIIPEDLTATTEFEIGNLDILAIPVSEFSRYRSDPRRRDLISSLKGLNTYYVGLNCAKPPFDNPELRRALAYGIDKEKILGTIYEQRGRAARGPLPDILRKWPLQSRFQYDPRKARDLVGGAGARGLTVEFYINAEQEVIDIAEVIQSYVKDTGLNVRIKQLEWSAFKEAINKGEADMFYLSWWADYPDPENFLFPLFHSSNFGPAGNRTRYSNPMVDSLIEKGQAALDEGERDSSYARAEEIIVSESPWIPLWHRTDFIIRQPWITNYRIHPIYSMDKGLDVEIR